MSYNGSGTFQINTSGQPVVAGTVISSTAFNALTADLATGLSTAITKDGQTTTTARIPFAAGINSSLTTDSTNSTSGSIITAGGVGVAKALFVGTTANVAGAVTLQGALGVTGVTTVQAGTALLPAITTTGDTNTGIFFPAADTIAFSEGGAEAVRIDSSGNLGIGTASPNTKLTVGTPNTQTVALAGSFSGATPAIATGIGMVTVNSTDTVAVDKGGVLSFTANTTTLNGYAMGFIAGKYETAGAGVYSGYLQFGTSNSAGTIAERMRINSSGNVGIGTASPAYKLDVVGSVNVPADSSYVFGAGSDRFIKYRASDNDILFSFDSGDFYQQSIASSYHAWFTGNNERMRIDASGNVLMQTTSTDPSATRNNGVVVPAGGNAGRIFTRGSGLSLAIDSSSGTQIQWYTDNGSSRITAGNITSSGSSTAYNTSSDYRLKDNITPMTGALEKVSALKPVTYKWKADGSDSDGFIAHELAEVCPQAVAGEKDAVDADGNPVYQGIDTSFLVATLTAAIQELKALVDTQSSTITALTARITALETK